MLCNLVALTSNEPLRHGIVSSFSPELMSGWWNLLSPLQVGSSAL